MLFLASRIWLLKNICFASFLCSKATKECYWKLVACLFRDLFYLLVEEPRWIEPASAVPPRLVRIIKWLLSRHLPLTDLEAQQCVWVLMELVREAVSGGVGEAADPFYTCVPIAVSICFCWNKFPSLPSVFWRSVTSLQWLLLLIFDLHP